MSASLKDRPQGLPWDRLPFVVRKPEGGFDFWAPRSTGVYGTDCEIGAQYAMALMPQLRGPYGGAILAWIVRDMIDHSGEHDRGVVVGMMDTLGTAFQARPALSVVAGRAA